MLPLLNYNHNRTDDALSYSKQSCQPMISKETMLNRCVIRIKVVIKELLAFQKLFKFYVHLKYGLHCGNWNKTFKYFRIFTIEFDIFQKNLT